MPTFARSRSSPSRIDHRPACGDGAAHRHDVRRAPARPSARGRVTVRAKQRKAAPSGSSRHLHLHRARRGENAVCTTQRGQDPPYRANGKPAAEKRFDTFPAGSTRRKKNGHPARALPLQGGEPVARLLEGHAEARRQRLHVVAQTSAPRRGRPHTASAARRRRS